MSVLEEHKTFPVLLHAVIKVDVPHGLNNHIQLALPVTTNVELPIALLTSIKSTNKLVIKIHDGKIMNYHREFI
jgi:hypothetical protein